LLYFSSAKCILIISSYENSNSISGNNESTTPITIPLTTNHQKKPKENAQSFGVAHWPLSFLFIFYVRFWRAVGDDGQRKREKEKRRTRKTGHNSSIFEKAIESRHQFINYSK